MKYSLHFVFVKFLKWQPCHFPVMIFWLLWAIYLGFSQCLLLFMLVLLSPISSFNIFLLEMVQHCFQQIWNVFYFASNVNFCVAIVMKLFDLCMYRRFLCRCRVGLNYSFTQSNKQDSLTKLLSF